MKQILLSTWFLVGAVAGATESMYLVRPGGAIQRLIDSSYERVFRAERLHQKLCELFPGPNGLAYSLGVSLAAAKRIDESCAARSRGDGSPKLQPKRYLVSFGTGKPANIESWTKADNTTRLFLAKDTTIDELTRVLVHELAISLDGKMGLTYASYRLTEGLGADSEERGRQLASLFSHALFRPILMTFAAMRAFNVEALMEGQPLTSAEDHKACEARFREVLPTVQALEEESPRDDSFQAQLLDLMSRKNTPGNIEERLDEILNGTFQLPQSGGVTFCQYMARPRLDNVVWNFFGNGPRPRLTGGWRQSGGESIFSVAMTDLQSSYLIPVAEPAPPGSR